MMSLQNNVLENQAGLASVTSIPTACARHGRSFRSPWPSAKRSFLRELVTNPFERKLPIIGTDKIVKTVRPIFLNDSNDASDSMAGSINAQAKASQRQGRIHATWLGHATALVQFKGVPDPSSPSYINVLFDPVFSHRASPFSFIGPSRRLAMPCTVEALPDLHIVCISHNHYDHLDKNTITKLVKRDVTESTMFFVPLGCAKTLIKAGVPPRQIKEKDWWEEETLCFGAGKSVRITCTPSQHNSSRKLYDLNETLWCSWMVEHEDLDSIQVPAEAIKPTTDSEDLKLVVTGHAHVSTVSSVFFAGDTGYRATSDGPVCPAFAEIGRRFGPIDVAFIPIWRGGCLSGLSKLGLRLKPDAFVRKHHCTPVDAVDLHRDIQARISIAIHHSTFVGCEDEARWSVQLLKQACDRSLGRGVQFQRGGGKKRRYRRGGRFLVLDAGETIAV